MLWTGTFFHCNNLRCTITYHTYNILMPAHMCVGILVWHLHLLTWITLHFCRYVQLRTADLVQNWTRLAFLNVIYCMEGLFIIASAWTSITKFVSSYLLSWISCGFKYSHKYMPDRLGRLTWLAVRLWPRNSAWRDRRTMCRWKQLMRKPEKLFIDKGLSLLAFLK
jgi:hypothetical protein